MINTLTLVAHMEDYLETRGNFMCPDTKARLILCIQDCKDSTKEDVSLNGITALKWELKSTQAKYARLSDQCDRMLTAMHESVTSFRGWVK